MKITPEQKAAIHVNRERAYYLRQRNKSKMGKKGSRVTKVEVAPSSKLCWKERGLKKKGGEDVIEEDV